MSTMTPIWLSLNPSKIKDIFSKIFTPVLKQSLSEFSRSDEHESYFFGSLPSFLKLADAVQSENSISSYL